MADLSRLRKRRGTSKGSITKLSSRIKTLESKVHEPSTIDLANQLTSNLKTLDEQFKVQHFLVIDEIDEGNEGSLAKEQEILDNHDEEISTLSLRITQLVRHCSTASDCGARKTLSRRPMDLDTRLKAVQSASDPLSSSPEHIHLLQQYHEQLNDFKAELGSIRQSVLETGLESTDALFETIHKLDKGIFDVMLNLKRLLYPCKDDVKVPSDSSPSTHGVRLPKLDVPMFNGDILKWITFWEQFTVAVHDRTHLSNAEKLAYLRHSLKDGATKGIIVINTMKRLRDRFNRPKLIHEAHVQKIIEIPTL